MRENTLRDLLDGDQPTLGTRILSVWPGVVEALGLTRAFDYVEFLGEYAPFHLHDLENLCRAAELHHLAPVLKVDQEPRTFLAQRGIGAGFQGVLFADCRSAADARACVAAARPETPDQGGTFGVATRRFGYIGYGGSEEYVRAIERIVVGLMIEKREAVEALDDILRVPGISFVQFGAFDYAMSIGKPGQARGEEVRSVEREVIERCLSAGVRVRAEIASPAQVAYYRELGVRDFALGVDLLVLYEWWREHGTAIRAMLSP